MLHEFSIINFHRTSCTITYWLIRITLLETERKIFFSHPYTYNEKNLTKPMFKKCPFNGAIECFENKLR